MKDKGGAAATKGVNKESEKCRIDLKKKKKKTSGEKRRKKEKEADRERALFTVD